MFWFLFSSLFTLLLTFVLSYKETNPWFGICCSLDKLHEKRSLFVSLLGSYLIMGTEMTGEAQALLIRQRTKNICLLKYASGHFSCFLRWVSANISGDCPFVDGCWSQACTLLGYLGTFGDYWIFFLPLLVFMTKCYVVFITKSKVYKVKSYCLHSSLPLSWLQYLPPIPEVTAIN